MKRHKRHRLLEYASLATVVLVLSACSHAELADGSPVNGTPVTFSATGIENQQDIASRSAADGTWDSGMTVGIKIGEEVKTYVATPDTGNPEKATLAAAEGTEPFYWKSSAAAVSVTAWYPHTDGQTEPSEVLVESDQSTRANYDASGFIIAEQEVSYSKPSLTFSHRTAKVTLNFHMSATGSTASVSELKLCNLTGLKDGGTEVIPFQRDINVATFEALLPEQTLPAGCRFFSLTLSGHSYEYTWTTPQSYGLKAGSNTVFNFTLANKDIIFGGSALAEWQPGEVTEGSTFPSTRW